MHTMNVDWSLHDISGQARRAHNKTGHKHDAGFEIRYLQYIHLKIRHLRVSNSLICADC